MNDDFHNEFMKHNPRSFFHIDWSGNLESKSFVKRTRLTNKELPEINSFAAALDLDALSFFGEKHLWGDRSEWATACRELMCEWVRRERFGNEPSRLHCLFGFESIDDVNAFCEREQLKAPSVWRVLAIDYSEPKDMKWFERDGTLMEKLYYVDCYWRGLQTGSDPAWEILLHPSIYVEDRVT